MMPETASAQPATDSMIVEGDLGGSLGTPGDPPDLPGKPARQRRGGAARAANALPIEKRVLKVGERIPGNLVVRMILGQSPIITVYTTEDGQLRWVYHLDGRMPPQVLKSVARFDALKAEIISSVPKVHNARAMAQLGKALFAVVESGETEHMEDYFAEVANFIKSKALPPARLHYIAGSTAFAALSVAVLSVVAQFTILSDKPQSLVVIGGIGGSIGGLISVLQRSTSLDVDYNWEKTYLLIQGGMRVVLGMLFGIFALLASDADLILGFVKDNLSSMVVLASVAGLSERFVPEIIKRFESHSAGGS
jgi:hypothetical protein